MSTIDTLSACTLACGFFSRALLAEPTQDFLETLGKDDLFAEWPLPADSDDTAKGLETLRAFFAVSGPEAMHAVSRDHTELFIGPTDPVPVWESVWTTRERLLFDEPTFEVRRIFAAYGLEAPDNAHQPDDHIGLEFAFVAHLLTLALRAADDGAPQTMRDHIASARAFIADHLGVWGPKCLDQIAEKAATNYYRGIAQLGRGTLAQLDGILAGVETA
jgi:TorA maturation chaperone TorD